VTNFPLGAAPSTAPAALPTKRVRAMTAANAKAKAATAASAATDPPTVPAPMQAEEGLSVRCTDADASDAAAWLLLS